MCRYCNGNPEPIDNISNCPTDVYIEEELFTKENGFLLKIVSDVDMGMGGEINVLTSVEIDYCPFCGRKLINV